MTDPKATYDPEVDAIGIYFRPADAKPGDSVEIAPGLTLDYDSLNRVVGLEILGVRDLLTTGRTPAADGSHLAPYAWGPDPFQAALDRYSATFPDEGLPFLRGAQAMEDQPVVIALLDWAAMRRRPLGWWQVMAALGYPPPPEGVCL